MKNIIATTSLIALTAGAAHAGGIDRSGQGLGALFEKGRYLELSFGSVNPSVTGKDVALFGGGSTGSVGLDYTQLGLSYKYDVNEKLSFALNIDQPFGADVKYGPTSVALGNTAATAKSSAITGILRYKMNENVSVHGGLRAQRASAAVDLRGAAYGAVTGYSVRLDSDVAAGYVVGVAYEKPEIALRVALTYNSAIKHNFNTTESGPNVDPDGAGPLPALPLLNGTSTTTVKTPQSVNLDFQSGVAKDTLVFGQIRWVDWSSFKLDPARFKAVTGGGLINLDDSVTYTLGVGRRFNENWSGSVSFQYEKKGNPLVSPLAPTNGRLGVTLAGVYTRDNMKVTAGINYTKVGDAQPQTANTARANMTGNHSVAIGVRVGFSF